MSGKLYIVATPIGNLGDISIRAVDILKSVDLVLAEDTRHSKKLFAHYEIGTSLRAFHEHNEKDKTEGIINELSYFGRFTFDNTFKVISYIFIWSFTSY